MRSPSISQSKAIAHGSGPMLVLAGPGSGKTFVITRRIQYLIEEHHVEPEEILVITFSKAAALEMKERFVALCNDKYYPVNFGTFHAIFYHILKNTFHYQSSNIITESEKREYLKIILNHPKYEVEDSSEMIEILLSEISHLKNNGGSKNVEKNLEQSEKKSSIDKKQVMENRNLVKTKETLENENNTKQKKQSLSKMVDEGTFYSIYKEYNRLMKEHRKLDFDDMVLHCYYLLAKNPDILTEWKNKYRYLLIDEYQDINRLQYNIVKLMLGDAKNLFVVGDDDQAIYKFRGSDPKIMMSFKKDFPDAIEVLLETNYRSTKNIVSSAITVISENKVRFQKEIKASREEGSLVEVKAFETREEEYDYFIKEILYLKESGISYHEIACIFRTNMNASYLTETLTENKIPYVLKEKPKNIYTHFIAKDLLSYLSFIFREQSRNHFFSIMNKPKRYLNRNCAPNTIVDFQEILQFYKEKSYMQEIIRKLQYDIERMRQMDLFSATNYIRKAVGYDEYIKQMALEKGWDVKELIEIASEFQSRTRNYGTLEELFIHIKEYEKELEESLRNTKEKEGIKLITMHASKGLEFPVVFLLDCNEGITPHKKSEDKEDIEEERRMFYVGMTRAKDRLKIYYVEGTKKEPVMVSRFLRGLLKK